VQLRVVYRLLRLWAELQDRSLLCAEVPGGPSPDFVPNEDIKRTWTFGRNEYIKTCWTWTFWTASIAVLKLCFLGGFY